MPRLEADRRVRLSRQPITSVQGDRRSGYPLACGGGRVSEPEPPRNVRAVMADGREIPVDCHYSGRENDIHQWTAVWSLPERPKSLLVAMLPAKTSIAFRWEEV